MRDRQPTKVLENGALRYGVYDETGALLRYEYLALEDAPSDVGTDLSKANLLTDNTETALFGSAADRTINETFAGIAGQLKLIMSDTASITVTLKDSAGVAIPGVLVQGILSESGQAVYSNTSGVVSGYIPEGSQTIKVTGYADIVDYSETISVTKGTSITKTITLTTRDFLKITSSRSVMFSGNVDTVDVAAGAAGGGGAGLQDSGQDSACGGGGGHVNKMSDIQVIANQSYPVVVGAGGIGGKRANGSDGGNSSALGATAQGGTGGKLGDGASYRGLGNGNGGYVPDFPFIPTAGENGTETMYASFEDESSYGGGGGALHRENSDYYRASDGGSPGGGDGFNIGENGADELGGGGGAGNYTGVSSDTGGKGGSGCVAIRMHLKSAA